LEAGVSHNLAMAREKRQWILAAGPGTLHLPDQVIWCAEALGTRLASGDYGLVTGGWQGVDHVTSRAFAEELMRRRENVLDRLVQVVKEGTFPDYRGGRAAYFKEYFDGFTAAIQRADAVVLLGGVGGTYDLAYIARQQGLPVFPVPGTGGDALRFYDTLRESSAATAMVSPTLSELDTLNRPITNKGDAEMVIEALENQLGRSLNARGERNRIFISYSREDCVWLNLFKTVLEQYLPEQRFLVWDDTQIEAGDRFREAIDAAIGTARMAVLLVSSRFCKSEFIQQNELPALCRAAGEGRLRLFWLLIDDCKFGLASQIEALHAPYLPLAEMKDASQQLSTIHEICSHLQQGF